MERRRLTPKRIVASITAVALLAGFTAVASAATTNQSVLLVSAKADRSNAVSLTGYTAKGNAYVFLNRSNVAQVAFSLDGKAYSTELVKPYDLASTASDGTARPLDTTTLAEGKHTVIASVKTTTNRARTYSAQFTVANKVVTPTTSTTAKPTTTTVKPTTTTTAAPTTTTVKPTTTTVPSTTIPPSSTGFANASNTGYKNAPGYPGSLTTFTGTLQSNTTYKFMRFPGGLGVGSSSTHLNNITFIGCSFESNALDDANVAVYSDNVTFSYSTFQPSKVATWPLTYNQGYQYGIDQRFDGKLTVDHSDFWGWGNGIQIGYSSQAKPLTVTNSWFHDARDDGGIDHTDAILENYGGSGFSYMTFSGNTIVSEGNTNGLALQDGSQDGYDHLTVTNNYFSGFGYTVNIGGHGVITNSLISGNVFGNDIKPVYGPLYDWNPGTGTKWVNNKFANVPGGYAGAPANGTYWWPTDSSGHSTDYTGK